MAVDVGAAAGRSSAALETVAGRVLALPARWLLAGIVTISFLVRAAIGLTHATPEYMPDEYIYSSLARSLALHGKPLIRGHLVHFPSLLEPILAAPFWLTGDHTFAYRATLLENALAMSLAAIPVYLLASHLQLGRNYALGAAAFTVTVQSLFFTTFVLADPVAYPLALTTLLLGSKTLENPSRKNQLLFLTLCALTALARIQYLALPLAYIAAALIQTRANPRQLRKHALTITLLTLPALTLLALGPHKLLGYYNNTTHLHYQPTNILHWAATDTLLLSYATGIILIPAALTTLLTQTLKPTNPRTQAFATLTLTTTLTLLTETALYASNGTNRFQERYLITLIPLAPLLYGLHQKTRKPNKTTLTLTTLTALTLLLLATRIPLSTFTAGQDAQDSPLLMGVTGFEKWLGIANGSLLVACVASVFALAAIFVAMRGSAAWWGLGAALAACLALAVSATWINAENSSRVRAFFLAADPSWVDHAQLANVALVQTPGADDPPALVTMFWNRSISNVLLLDGVPAVDAFGAAQVRVAPDGTMLVGDRPVRSPLLLQSFAASATLRDATHLGRGATFDLWRPNGAARLELYARGRYYDGWLANRGRITVWPGLGNDLRLSLSLPAGQQATSLHLHGPGVARTISLQAGQRETVTLCVPTGGPWTVRFDTPRPGSLPDGRFVSLKAAMPTLGSGACAPARG